MIAFVFPGQGSQKVGMGRTLAEEHSICRETMAEADAALGEPLSRLCYQGPDEQLRLTENTQPAILAVSVAAARLLAAMGVSPTFVAGHSLGEYAAHVVAGTFSFGDALRTVRRRGRYMQEAVPDGVGAMAAVLGLAVEAVEQACAEAARGEVVSPANINAPDQVVIAGTAAAVTRAGEAAKRRGAKRVVPLTVSAPFHCALMAPAQMRLEPVLRALTVERPDPPVVTNVDAEPTRDAAGAIDALIRQVVAPVRWTDVIRRLASEGVRDYVEVGPGTVLTGLLRKIDRTARGVSVDDRDGVAGVERLLQDS